MSGTSWVPSTCPVQPHDCYAYLIICPGFSSEGLGCVTHSCVSVALS